MDFPNSGPWIGIIPFRTISLESGCVACVVRVSYLVRLTDISQVTVITELVQGDNKCVLETTDTPITTVSFPSLDIVGVEVLIGTWRDGIASRSFVSGADPGWDIC